MAERRYLICGGCGFIGSNFVHTLCAAESDAQITVVDLLTYAGSTDNLEPLLTTKRVDFAKVDITDAKPLRTVFEREFDVVVNFAAETHVDRSLYYPNAFVRSNILGVDVLLSLCREFRIPFLQVSTDEVYGPAPEGVTFTEQSPLNPTSPYAASKASADLLTQAAVRTFRQEAVIVRTSNNYGPRQFPEKVIPYFLYLLAKGEPLPMYGDGLHRRCWIYVGDFCRALIRLLDSLPTGEVFNIGSGDEISNLDLAQKLIELSGVEAEIKYVADRPGHDRRYSIDSSKFEQRFGEITRTLFENGLKDTIGWYQNNPGIFSRMSSDEAQRFRHLHYQDRR